jgi:hypothetical protein
MYYTLHAQNKQDLGLEGSRQHTQPSAFLTKNLLKNTFSLSVGKISLITVRGRGCQMPNDS